MLPGERLQQSNVVGKKVGSPLLTPLGLIYEHLFSVEIDDLHLKETATMIDALYWPGHGDRTQTHTLVSHLVFSDNETDKSQP